MFLKIILFCLFSCIIRASERILLFQSDIAVHQDATVIIAEKIIVESYGKQIKRGIIRELPGKFGNLFPVLPHTNSYQIISVKKDGNPVCYSVIRGHKKEASLEIHIGGDALIAHGKYTYEIIYKTDDFVDFYKNHDELYINITGNYWRLPIDKVKASITLPEGIDPLSVITKAYTGRLGERRTDYQYTIENNTIFFETTRPFRTGEGITAVVTWNKGVVEKPFWYLHWYENPFFYIVIIAFLLQLLFLMYLVIVRYRHNNPGIIVPLFRPPEGMSPSLLGFLTNLGSFKDRFLIADIIQLAVDGYITITPASSSSNIIQLFFENKKYTLTLVKKERAGLYQEKLLTVLFGQNTVCEISQKNRKNIEAFAKEVTKQCKEESKQSITGFSFALLSIVPIVSCALFFSFFSAGYRFVEIYLTLHIVSSVIFFAISAHFNRWYTHQGRKLQDSIDGFLLFLNAVEIDRINTIGTPPTKTPELYEKYLPFAIAIGAEYRWSKQFEKIFADMDNTGMAYRPRWYVSNKPFSLPSFSSHLSSHLASSFRSSGARGRGSSGGGRGGGGGGGR